jgi:hypothetical protein
MRTVSYRDLGALVSRIPKERHKSAVRAIRSTMNTRARVIVREEINGTKPRPPVDRGSYTASWKAENVEDGGKIFSTSLYASVIDQGRRPGTMPPIGPLMGWVHRHQLSVGAALESRISSRRKAFREFLYSKMSKAQLRAANRKIAQHTVAGDEKSIAFAIAMAIKKRGIPAKHVFERACKRIVAECKAAVKLAIAGAEFNERSGG